MRGDTCHVSSRFARSGLKRGRYARTHMQVEAWVYVPLASVVNSVERPRAPTDQTHCTPRGAASSHSHPKKGAAP